MNKSNNIGIYFSKRVMKLPQEKSMYCMNLLHNYIKICKYISQQMSIYDYLSPCFKNTLSFVRTYILLLQSLTIPPPPGALIWSIKILYALEFFS